MFSSFNSGMCKSLGWTKFKPSADDILNAAEMIIFVFDRVENIVGKRRNCLLSAFSLFPTFPPPLFFFKSPLVQSLKVGNV